MNLPPGSYLEWKWVNQVLLCQFYEETYDKETRTSMERNTIPGQVFSSFCASSFSVALLKLFALNSTPYFVLIIAEL